MPLIDPQVQKIVVYSISKPCISNNVTSRKYIRHLFFNRALLKGKNLLL